MADSPANTPMHRWTDIQRLGLLHNVSSILDYDRLTTLGALYADEYLTEFILNKNCFELDVAVSVHSLVFGEVHPWAGQFRAPGEAVILGGYAAADAWRILRELQLLEIQTDLLPTVIEQGLSEPEMAACLCAFHHIRFERIHPFRDGNGRVGRLILAGAVRQIFGRNVAFPWERLRTSYMAALREGNKLNLAPLANLLLQVLDLDPILTAVKAPFRVAPRMFESVIEPEIEDDLNWSRIPTK